MGPPYPPYPPYPVRGGVRARGYLRISKGYLRPAARGGGGGRGGGAFGPPQAARRGPEGLWGGAVGSNFSSAAFGGHV